jgi:ATP-dependent 26S proteasome regulatory subunit
MPLPTHPLPPLPAPLARPRSTFIRVSGAELVQKYIGEGSRMVRELFVMARESAPAIIFMDEVRSS